MKTFHKVRLDENICSLYNNDIINKGRGQGLKLFSENIIQFIGQTVRIYIYHKIYGNQQSLLKNFQPLCSEDKIGFLVGEGEIYLTLDEIESVDVGKSALTINGILQKIVIEKV